MKKKYHNLNKTFFVVFSLIVFFSVQLTNPVQITAQSTDESIYGKNPQKYRKDDLLLCNETDAPRSGDTFCTYYKGYMNSETVNLKLAADYRNKMLFVLKREIDNYYNDYKIGREKKTKWFQTVLDILGIGLAFTGTVANGARVKTVIGAATGSFLAGRNSVNDRFQLLQIKILTNKMEANRLEQWIVIVENMKKDINDFSWDSARGELQTYYNRGFFEDALNSLVDETGAEVTTADNKLKILGAVSKNEFTNKFRNFDDYIRPMFAKSEKLDADIKKLTDEIAALPAGEAKTAKEAELVPLNTQKENLIKNYQTIWLAILASEDFATIEEKILTKTGLQAEPKEKFKKFITRLRNKEAIEAKDYDQYLAFVNGAVGEDEALNTNFLKILEANKLP